MPEQIEKIMRAIHILFSKGSKQAGSPDRVVVSKRELFDLLEKLNIAIAKVMEQYEATNVAKEQNKIKMEQMGQRIIDSANKSAEDVYAASLLYTDGALVELQEILENTKAGVLEDFDRFEDMLNVRMETVRNNQKELLEQMAHLVQAKKYQEIIDEYNAAHCSDEIENEDEENENETSDNEDEESLDSEDDETLKSEDEESLDNKADHQEQGEGVDGGPGEVEQKPNKANVKSNTKQKKRKKVIKLPVTIGLVDDIGSEEDAPVHQKIEVKVHAGGGMPENSIFKSTLPKPKKGRKHASQEAEQETSPELTAYVNQTISSTGYDLDTEYEQWQEQTRKSESTETKTKHGILDKLIGKK